jgi:hypothetical protein
MMAHQLTTGIDCLMAGLTPLADVSPPLSTRAARRPTVAYAASTA